MTHIIHEKQLKGKLATGKIEYRKTSKPLHKLCRDLQPASVKVYKSQGGESTTWQPMFTG